MAKKGSSKHLKRYAAPRALRLPRKSITWTIRPAPGPHPSESALPLGLLVRDYLGLAKTAKESGRVLAGRKVLVDGRPRRDPKFPLGLMDLVSIPEVGVDYRILINRRGRLVPHRIDRGEASFKPCRVDGKSIVRGGRIQLAFHDGKTLVGDFGEYKTKDTVKLSVPDLQLLERVPFGSGVLALVTGGKNVGMVGRITEVKIVAGASPNVVTLETSDGQVFQAPEDYVFVLGGEKPLISIPG